MSGGWCYLNKRDAGCFEAIGEPGFHDVTPQLFHFGFVFYQQGIAHDAHVGVFGGGGVVEAYLLLCACFLAGGAVVIGEEPNGAVIFYFDVAHGAAGHIAFGVHGAVHADADVFGYCF